MRKLSTEKRTAIISALVEGCSIASTCRMCGVAKLTVLRLLSDIGSLCRDYHDWKVRGLSSESIEVDEIWSFVGCKEANRKRGKQGDGDCWTWTAIDADSKLIISYLIGLRTGAYAEVFMEDIADRVDTPRPQITSDGLSAYPEAVDKIFGADVDYAQLVKTYGRDPDEPEHRYSPAKCISVEMGRVQGNPDRKNISTSYIERSNLTVRMANRRFTRLTNAFSKKWQNHVHALALQFFWYNFGRKHITLKGKTPAMVTGLTDRAWTVADLVKLLEDEERKLMKGGRINREDRS